MDSSISSTLTKKVHKRGKQRNRKRKPGKGSVLKKRALWLTKSQQQTPTQTVTQVSAQSQQTDTQHQASRQQKRLIVVPETILPETPYRLRVTEYTPPERSLWVISPSDPRYNKYTGMCNSPSRHVIGEGSTNDQKELEITTNAHPKKTVKESSEKTPEKAVSFLFERIDLADANKEPTPYVPQPIRQGEPRVVLQKYIPTPKCKLLMPIERTVQVQEPEITAKSPKRKQHSEIDNNLSDILEIRREKLKEAFMARPGENEKRLKRRRNKIRKQWNKLEGKRQKIAELFGPEDD